MNHVRKGSGDGILPGVLIESIPELVTFSDILANTPQSEFQARRSSDGHTAIVSRLLYFAF